MRVCARVLAAALMTGAVAGAFTFPALFQHGREGHRLLLAPPSSQQRTLRVPALGRPAGPELVHIARPSTAALKKGPTRPRPAPSLGQFARAAIRGPKTARPRPARPAPEPAPGAPPASATPSEPQPPAATTPVEPPRELAAEAPPPTPPVQQATVAPPPPAADESDDDHGNGHAYGHDKHGPDDNAADDNGSGHGNGKG